MCGIKSTRLDQKSLGCNSQPFGDLKAFGERLNLHSADDANANELRSCKPALLIQVGGELVQLRTGQYLATFKNRIIGNDLAHNRRG